MNARGPAALLLAGLLFLPVAASPEGARPPVAPSGAPRQKRAEEVRAIWITRWDFRTEDEVRRAVAGCAALGFNRVILQVRGQADAYYRSGIEPWGEELRGPPERGGDPGFDPLDAAVDEARRRGVELHAWLNLLPAWKGTEPPRDRRHLFHAHPEWFLTDAAGRRRMLVADRYALLNPCLPAVREHIAHVAGDIASRYAVDGIQIDYVRFLERNTRRGEDVPYDAATLALFREAAGSTPDERPAAWDLFRRRAVDHLVREVAAAIRARRPACRISLAAIRDAEHARAHLFQDAAGWLGRGWLDEVVPMVYEEEPARFAACLRRWTEACGGRAVVAGVGVHLLAGPEALTKELVLSRAAGPGGKPAGYCLFAYGDFFPSRSRDARPGDAERRARMRAALGALQRPAEAP